MSVRIAAAYVPALAAREWPGGIDLHSLPLTADTLKSADCVVIITDHRVFDYDAIVSGSACSVASFCFRTPNGMIPMKTAATRI